MKTTFDFNDKVTAKLEQLAENSQSTKADVLRRAIALYDLLESKKGGHDSITIKSHDGKETELVLP